MTGIVIQARMGSTRSPGKVMSMIAGQPLLHYVFRRCKKSRYADRVIVATTESKADDSIHDWCNTNGILVYRGNENDVLDRYYRASEYYQLDTVVRVTSDCPFVDPQIIDMLILLKKNLSKDYVSNRILGRTWPHGLDVEVFSMAALEVAWREAQENYEREHVTPYIMENSSKFKQMELALDSDLSYYRLTVDYPEDLEFTRVLIEEFNASGLDWQELIELLSTRRDLLKINSSRSNTKLW